MYRLAFQHTYSIFYHSHFSAYINGCFIPQHSLVLKIFVERICHILLWYLGKLINWLNSKNDVRIFLEIEAL